MASGRQEKNLCARGAPECFLDTPFFGGKRDLFRGKHPFFGKHHFHKREILYLILLSNFFGRSPAQ